MANQISVNSGSGAGAQQIVVSSGGNITVTTSRSVIGTVANVASANYANFAGEVVDPAQPNITSVGNLTSLNVVGTTTTGNLVVLGNLQIGNLTANNANYANFAGEAYSVSGANVNGTVANAAYAANAGYADNAGNSNFANTATNANNANIANTAYSVNVANVSGIGNIATVNLDGNSSNVLKGDGTFGPEGTTGNANYANFAGTAYSVSGSNVSGAVANATYADNAGNANIANIAYSVDGGNVSGAVSSATYANDAGNANIANVAYSVDVANVSGIGNIATINLDGNVSNALLGDGTFGPVELDTANYANFAGNAFAVDGANVNGAVANATYADNAGNANIANVAYSVDGANVSGEVANAAYANDAGNANIANVAYSVDVANVSGIGNIATINLDGNIANALLGDGTFGPVELDTANYANFAGEVTNSAQPNITSVGTLIDLNVASSNALSIDTTDQLNSNADAIRLTSTANSIILDSNSQITLSAIASTSNYPIEIQGPTNSLIFKDDGNIDITANEVNIVGAVNGDTIKANFLHGDGSNISNIDGANVTGTVANATFALDAGNANIANVAYSVDGANVSGTVANATFADDAGNANIANIAYSVDVANVSGIGNIATINLDGNVSNALLGDGTWGAVELTTAQTVTDNAQPNITSTGNLVALTINANVANTTTIQIDPNIISFAGSNYYSITNAYGPNAVTLGTTRDAKVLSNYSGFEEFRTEYYGSQGGNVAKSGLTAFQITSNIGNSGTDPLIPGGILFQTFTSYSNLANANTRTFSQFSIDDVGVGMLLNGPQPNPIFQMFSYGSGAGQTQKQTGILFNRRSGNGDVRGGVVAGDYLGNIEWRGAFTSTGGFGTNSARAMISPKIASTYAGPGTGPTPIDMEIVIPDVANHPNSHIHTFYSNGNVGFSDSITANVVTANYFSGEGGNLSNIQGANVSGTVANATYALDAGNVTDNAQPNITSTGNLVSLTINDGSSNNNSVFQPTGTIVNGNTYVSVDQRDIGSGNAKDAVILANAFNGNGYFIDFLPSDGNTTVSGPSIEVRMSSNIGPGNVAVPASFNFFTYANASNLTTGDKNLQTGLQISEALSFLTGAPAAGNTPVLSTFSYGVSFAPESSTALRTTRRRGNATSRVSLEPNDYLGNIEWRGAVANGGLPAGSRFAKIAPRVDSSYVANTAAQPVGIEFWVTDNTTARSHTFYANGNVGFSDSVTANGIIANTLGGELTTNAQPNITSVGILSNLDVTGNIIGNDIFANTINLSTGNISLYGANSSVVVNGDAANSNIGSLALNDSTMSMTLDNVDFNTPAIVNSIYVDTDSIISPTVYYRARGTEAAPNNVQGGDFVKNEQYFAYGDSGNTNVSLGRFRVDVISNDNDGNVPASIMLATANSNDGSQIVLESDGLNFQGNISTPFQLTYPRTYGSFLSNVTQTSNGANTTNFMTFNNTVFNDSVTIDSDTLITINRPGYYNIQFSAQVEKTDAGTDIVEIWLVKNGTAVSDSATQVQLTGNGAKDVAAWDFGVDAANVGDYFQIAWASADTNVQLTAIDGANTISGVGVPSVLLTVNPVGA